MPRWRRFLIALLLLAAGFQTATTLWASIPDLSAAWKTLGQPAVWRGVNYSVSSNFAGYIEFIRSKTPEDARLVIPSQGDGPWALGLTPYMQFFLAPRQILNCPGENIHCPADLSDSGAYLLFIGPDQFPGVGVIQDVQRLEMYNDSWGVYPPVGAADLRQATAQPDEGFSSLAQILLVLVVAALAVALLTASGWGVIQVLAPQFDPLSQVALAFGIGAGLFTLLLYICLLFGDRLTKPLILFAIVFTAGVNLFVYWLFRRKKPASHNLSHSRKSTDLVDVLSIAILLIFAASATFLAFGRGYFSTDEIVLWGVKGYGITVLGLRQGVTEWGTRTAEYPLNIPLLIATARKLTADRLPESKLLFPIFYTGLLVLMYGFLRRRMAALIACLLTLAYGAAPLIFRHATIAYANLPLTYYLTAAAISLAWAGTEPSISIRLRLLILSGVSLALAAWTRPEGLALSILFAAVGGLQMFFHRGKKLRLAEAAGLCGPLLIYIFLWIATSPLVYRGTTWVGAEFKLGLSEAFVGTAYLQSLIYVLKNYLFNLINLQVWGVLGFMVLSAIFGIGSFVRFNWPTTLLVSCGMALTLSILVAYPLLASTPDIDISWWVNTGLNRMLMPGMTILWLGVTYGLTGAQST